MYEHPSIRLELARQKQDILLSEARAERVHDVDRAPSVIAEEATGLLRSVAERLRKLARPVAVHVPGLEPSS